MPSPTTLSHQPTCSSVEGRPKHQGPFMTKIALAKQSCVNPVPCFACSGTSFHVSSAFLCTPPGGRPSFTIPTVHGFCHLEPGWSILTMETRATPAELSATASTSNSNQLVDFDGLGLVGSGEKKRRAVVSYSCQRHRCSSSKFKEEVGDFFP